MIFRFEQCMLFLILIFATDGVVLNSLSARVLESVTCTIYSPFIAMYDLEVLVELDSLDDRFVMLSWDSFTNNPVPSIRMSGLPCSNTVDDFFTPWENIFNISQYSVPSSGDGFWNKTVVVDNINLHPRHQITYKSLFTFENLLGNPCVLYNGSAAFSLDVGVDDFFISGNLHVSVFKPNNISDESSGVFVESSTVCKHSVDLRRRGYVSTMNVVQPTALSIVWLFSECVNSGEYQRIVLETCVNAEILLANPVLEFFQNETLLTSSELNYTIESFSTCDFRLPSNDTPSLVVLLCCQEWDIFINDTSLSGPNTTVRASVLWEGRDSPEPLGSLGNGTVRIQRATVIADIIVSVDDSCTAEPIDIGDPPTTGGLLRSEIFEDDSFTNPYLVETGELVSPNQKVCLFVDLAILPLFRNGFLALNVTAIRVCSGPPSPTIVPLDFNNPLVTGCRSPGITQAEVVYNATPGSTVDLIWNTAREESVISTDDVEERWCWFMSGANVPVPTGSLVVEYFWETIIIF